MNNIFEDAKFGDKFKARGFPNEYVILWQKVKLQPWYIDHYRNNCKKEPPLKEFMRFITKDGEIFCVDMSGNSSKDEFYDIVGKWNDANKAADEYSMLPSVQEAFKAGYNKALE